MNEIKIGDRVRYKHNDVGRVAGLAGKVTEMWVFEHNGLTTDCARVAFEKFSIVPFGTAVANLEKVSEPTDETAQRIAGLEGLLEGVKDDLVKSEDEKVRLNEHIAALEAENAALVKERDELRLLINACQQQVLFPLGEKWDVYLEAEENLHQGFTGWLNDHYNTDYLIREVCKVSVELNTLIKKTLNK